MEILSKTDVRVLCEARFVLQGLEKSINWEAIRTLAEARELHDIVNLGKLVEAASHADDTIFGILNLLSSHFHDPLAEENVHEVRAPFSTPFGTEPEEPEGFVGESGEVYEFDPREGYDLGDPKREGPGGRW